MAQAHASGSQTVPSTQWRRRDVQEPHCPHQRGVADDTDVMELNDDVEVTGKDLLPLVQLALDLWSGGISATGGAINPAKSFWWLIDFKWRRSSGTWVFQRKAEMPGKLTIQEPTGLWATLRRLQLDEAERTLGVMMAPLETGTAPHLPLQENAKNWAAKFCPQHLLPDDVLPLIKHDAPSLILQVSLHKTGVCHSFPRVGVFATLKYQGVFHHLSVLMRHSASTWRPTYSPTNSKRAPPFPCFNKNPPTQGFLPLKNGSNRFGSSLTLLASNPPFLVPSPLYQ
ncbi:unnamed protein product [Cylindrotheca closterium]|uniref:Uncharacterized protein n=1 Tax=Cylindrotheca closterium TaxID=2856 RepID=A0AAD2FNE8_9STRA|nr:unnamed protein product [Cylindrotheca closterium]